MDLFVPVLVAGRLLVEALKVAVHALVELPGHVHGKHAVLARLAPNLGPFSHAGFVVRHPVLHFGGVLEHRRFAAAVFGQRDHRRHLRTDEGGHVDFVDGQVSDGSATVSGFVNAFGGEGDVHPAGEQVGSVPHRLAVAHQDEQGHGGASDRPQEANA